MTDWTELAVRCEAATGPDLEIDTAIAQALGWKALDYTNVWRVWKNAAGTTISSPYTYTGDLNVITAMIEQKLPDWHWRVQGGCRDTVLDMMTGGSRALLALPQQDGARAIKIGSGGTGWGTCATPALALCAAFCRAMAYKETTK